MSGTVEVVVLQLLSAIVQLAPGVLRSMSGTQTDAQAIERAREAVRAIPQRPVTDALDAYERGER